MSDSIDIFSAAALADDAEVRRQGIGFIDGSISGYALLMGDDDAAVSAIIESLIQRKVVVFITEDVLIAALREAGPTRKRCATPVSGCKVSPCCWANRRLTV
jgi:hypothetical protein